MRDPLTEVERVAFDLVMPVPSVMSHSISVWKRSMVPPQPESATQIDATIPFFNMLDGVYYVLYMC